MAIIKRIDCFYLWVILLILCFIDMVSCNLITNNIN